MDNKNEKDKIIRIQQLMAIIPSIPIVYCNLNHFGKFLKTIPTSELMKIRYLLDELDPTDHNYELSSILRIEINLRKQNKSIQQVLPPGYDVNINNNLN
jgi:hypothetical protein